MKLLTEHISCFIREQEISLGCGPIRWHLLDVYIYRVKQLPDGNFCYDHDDLLSCSTFNMN